MQLMLVTFASGLKQRGHQRFELRSAFGQAQQLEATSGYDQGGAPWRGDVRVR